MLEHPSYSLCLFVYLISYSPFLCNSRIHTVNFHCVLIPHMFAKKAKPPRILLLKRDERQSVTTAAKSDMHMSMMLRAAPGIEAYRVQWAIWKKKKNYPKEKESSSNRGEYTKPQLPQT